MLGEVIKKYESNKKANQKQMEATRERMSEQIEALTIHALKLQNHKVLRVHANQKEIQFRLKKNSELNNSIKSHIQAWWSHYENINTALKEAGDIANYAKYVQEEARQINIGLQSKGDQN